MSIPGVGEGTAFAMPIEMPELGAIEHKGAASLAGLAPIARDSSQHSGQRFIPPARRPDLDPKTLLINTDTLGARRSRSRRPLSGWRPD